MTHSTIADNIIIGAGLAGLYCAWQLHKQQRSFILLEAEHHAGGRIRAASETTPVDTGATWFWPHQHKIARLLQELDIPVLQQFTDGDSLFQPASTGGAAPVQKMQYQQALSYRIANGTTRLTETLRQKLPEQAQFYGSKVTSIARSQDQGTANHWQVKVTPSAKSRGEKDTPQIFESQNLFIAIPPRMVVQHLTPERWLPSDSDVIEHLKQQQTWMSAQAKYIAVFDKPYWREKGLSGFAISQQGPLAEIHDASQDDLFALFGFVGVPATQRKNLKPEDLKMWCRQQLCSLFDMPEPKHDDIQDWSRQNNVVTSWDLEEPPRHSHVNMNLVYLATASLHCYFIASEFSQTEPGYMEGALDAVDTALSKFNR